MSKLSFPERRRKLEAELTAATARYDAAVDAAATDKSVRAKGEKQMHRDRMAELREEIAALGREETRAAEKDEQDRAREAIAVSVKRHAAALEQIEVIRGLGAKMSATFKAAADMQVQIFAELAKLNPLLTDALGHAPDGDTSGMAISDALKQVMVFRGLAPGFAEREEPSIQAAVYRILGNFAGQVQISARKRGLTLPA